MDFGLVQDDLGANFDLMVLHFLARNLVKLVVDFWGVDICLG